MRRLRRARALVLLGLLPWLAAAGPEGAMPELKDPPRLLKSHGQSLAGPLKYAPDFPHFDYVNPNAPKGGELRLAAIGTFDSLNPFILKGNAAAPAGRVYEQLMARSPEEPAAQYGLLAESVETDEEGRWVAFNLRPQARWHDGKPLTADDVAFSLQILKEKGDPHYRHYYKNVVSAVAEGPHRVKFSFDGQVNRELPYIVGELTVLPKHWFEGRDFEKPSLDKPLGSGAYRLGLVEAGRTLVLEKVPDYWGRDLAVNRGLNNMERLRYDYYRDETVVLEAFKAGAFDFRLENSAKSWATAYDFPAARDGRVKLEKIANKLPSGMQGFAFNLRRAKFQDRRVRRALVEVMDYEWLNANLFYNAYQRSVSYFQNTELAATGLPGADEKVLLEPLRGRIPDEVFGEPYLPPKTDGTGNQRGQLRQAGALLKDAGWTITAGKLTNARGEPFTIEFLIESPIWERVANAYARSLERLGITVSIRLVDDSQYVARMRDYDYDMVVVGLPQSLSPGNEQRDYWSSAAADLPGTRNLMGIKDPAVDGLVDAIIAAPSRSQLVAATRALDRVLRWGHYVVPHWHLSSFRVAYWNRFGRPKTNPDYELALDSWWIDPALDAKLGRKPGK